MGVLASPSEVGASRTYLGDGVALHGVALRGVALRCVAFRGVSLRCVLLGVAWRCVALRCLARLAWRGAGVVPVKTLCD